MNTTTPKHAPTYSFTTCKRCGYIIAAEEELCENCQNQVETNPSLFK